MVQKAFEFLSENFDLLTPIQQYQYHLLLNNETKIQSFTRDLFYENKTIAKICSHQLDDGSWGSFHSLSTQRSEVMTTEQALRQLLIFGMNRQDQKIRKALDYLNQCLEGTQTIRDRVEKKYTWDPLIKLFIATWVKMTDNQNPQITSYCRVWKEIISHAFRSGHFNEKDYSDVYVDFIQPMKKENIFPPWHFYLVSLLSDQLDNITERAWLEYLMNRKEGIYYVYSHYLSKLPDDFQSKQTYHFLNGIELLLAYPSGTELVQPVIQWIEKKQSPKGYWDTGIRNRSDFLFALSDSWRNSKCRQIDVTLRIIKLIRRLPDYHLY